MKNNLLDNRLAARRAKFVRDDRGGAPLGNRNALKTGRYTREMRTLKRFVRERLRAVNAVLAAVKMNGPDSANIHRKKMAQ